MFLRLLLIAGVVVPASAIALPLDPKCKEAAAGHGGKDGNLLVTARSFLEDPGDRGRLSRLEQALVRYVAATRTVPYAELGVGTELWHSTPHAARYDLLQSVVTTLYQSGAWPFDLKQLIEVFVPENVSTWVDNEWGLARLEVLQASSDPVALLVEWYRVGLGVGLPLAMATTPGGLVMLFKVDRVREAVLRCAATPGRPRSAALLDLVQLGVEPSQAWPVLRDALAAGPDEDRIAAFSAIQLLPVRGEEAANEAFARISDPNPEIRALALLALAAAEGATERARVAAIAAARDRRSTVRAAAFGMLRTFGDETLPGARDAVLKGLTDARSGEVRAAAARAATLFAGDSSVADALLEAFRKETKKWARLEMALALGRTRSPKIIAALIPLLSSQEYDLACEAWQAIHLLGAHGPEVRAAAVGCVRSRSPRVREWATGWLEQHPSREQEDPTAGSSATDSGRR